MDKRRKIGHFQCTWGKNIILGKERGGAKISIILIIYTTTSSSHHGGCLESRRLCFKGAVKIPGIPQLCRVLRPAQRRSGPPRRWRRSAAASNSFILLTHCRRIGTKVPGGLEDSQEDYIHIYFLF